MTKPWITADWRMLAMLVASLVIGAGNAQASCGDYLDHVGGLTQRLSSSDVAEPGPASLPIPRIPCRGPGCQKAPPKPISPGPDRLAASELEQFGCVNEMPPRWSERRIAFVAESAERPQPGMRLSIEHPPRDPLP